MTFPLAITIAGARAVLAFGSIVAAVAPGWLRPGDQEGPVRRFRRDSGGGHLDLPQALGSILMAAPSARSRRRGKSDDRDGCAMARSGLFR